MLNSPTLPDLPSQLIGLALDDLNGLEKIRGYRVHMDAGWHDPQKTEKGKVCKVCLAGAVIARTIKLDPSISASPSSFGDDTNNKLLALNLFRMGAVTGGLAEMEMIEQAEYEGFYHLDREIVSYEVNRRQFKLDLRKLARDLKAEGL